MSLITLGVADLARARAFYEALGWTTTSAPDADVVFFQAGAMVFGLWDRSRLAVDSGVQDTLGFSGVVLAHNVASSDEVDAVMTQATKAGATITRQAGVTFWGGYTGVFTDLDGHPWEIAHNPGWNLHADGSVTLPA